MATLRNIPSFMKSATVAQIDNRLETIKLDHRVTIPLAIESGSRAWGFPSPDSDYDCRFIYVRSVDDYLSLFPLRDVIETPLENDLDVNGWDLAKAIKLLLKGNAVVVEWLTSPIIYSADAQFRDDFLQLADRTLNRELVARHYLHLGERQRRTYFADESQISLKKVFYALRPAAALRWLRLHPNEAVAPMNFQTLMAESEMPSDVGLLIEGLVVQKAITRELGSGTLPRPIAQFIDSEFAIALETLRDGARTVTDAAKEDAQQFFCATLSRLSA
jgi:predicted nucleotidyltransferase